jgi:hypothetical protein
MVATRWWSGAALVPYVCVVLTACAGAGPAAPSASGESATSPGDPTRSASAAAAPDGATAREVTYRCASGRQATLVVDVPDPADLAAVLNRIEPCEYDGGFRSGTVPLSCASGPIVVRLTGREGRMVQPPPDSLCS